MKKVALAALIASALMLTANANAGVFTRIGASGLYRVPNYVSRIFKHNYNKIGYNCHPISHHHVIVCTNYQYGELWWAILTRPNPCHYKVWLVEGRNLYKTMGKHWNFC